MLRTFLRPGYEQFYGQAFDLAVAYLWLRHVDSDTPEPLNSLTQALAIVFKEAFPLARDLLKQDPLNLDAIGTRLDGAYLARSDLRQIRLPEAYLRKANLYRAKICEANLREAKLCNAYLAEADFTKTNLREADLREVVLARAVLTEVNLNGANLTGGDLSITNIESALSMKDTDLRGVKGLTREQLEICMAKGAFIDEDTMNNAPQSTVSPPSSSPSSDTQTTPIPPAQASTPVTASDGSNTLSSQPQVEP